MALFQYKAVSPAGEVLEGALEAPGQAAVVERLREMGYVTIRAEEASPAARPTPARRRRWFVSKRVGTEQVAIFTDQLATLLGARLPLDRALEVLAGITEDEAVRAMTLRIRDDVRGGMALSVALTKQAGVFSRLYVNMVRAGEAGGALAGVLARLAEYMERANELRASVVSALIYPSILVAVSVTSVMALLIFVVPQFTELLEQSGKALPLPTQIVVTSGNFLREYWWALILGFVGLIYLFRKQLQRPAARFAWDAWLLRLPVIGDLIGKIETARFSRTLATLLGNGVPLLTGLSIVKETLGNTVLSEALGRVALDLKEGRGLGRPMMQQGLFPKLAVHMVMVGEETGQLEEMLVRVTTIYDREVQRSVKRALSLLEPVLILGMAVIIAGIILSILLALLSINELAR